MINKIYKHYGKADYNSMMNEGKTLEDIFNEASSDTEYIHIEFQNGVVAYGIAMKDGNIIGAAGNVISYNDAERARFTEEYEQRSAQGKYTTADDFPDSTRYAWERDYVISTLTDILVGGEITAYNMYAVKGADPIVYTDPMTIPQALQAATDEANKRIDEFTRIGLKSVPLDSVFFEISEDVDLRKFAETSDVNKLIILASQADANLWEGIMRSGGFKTSEVYARIADDVLSGQLILVDRDGNRLTSEHETEAVAADEDEEPVIEAPQYETTEPTDNDNNVSTVDRLSVQDGEQSTYNNADANPDAISAPDDEAAQDAVADEQNISEPVADDNEIEMDESDQSDEENNTDTDDKPESESEPVDNTTTTEDTDTTEEEESDETENLTDESVESDDELPKHGDADNDGIANGVDTDPYHADVEPTEDETETESDNADTANTEEPSEPVNTDDNTVSTSEDNEHDETSPKTTEFRIPDIEVPTLSTTEFNAVSKNESETEVKDKDELPKHGDADNDGIANAVDADPYNANVGSTEDETEVEPTEDEPVKQDSDTENASESDDENEQEDDSESEETTSDTETETESDEQSDDYSESEPAPVVESESANANYNAPAYADEKAVALFTTGLDDVDSELDSITDRRASLENTISEQDARIDNIHDIERQIGDMKAKTSRLEGMLDGMKAEADSYHDDVNEAKAELDRLDAREAELGKRSEWLHRAQEVLKQAGLL